MTSLKQCHSLNRISTIARAVASTAIGIAHRLFSRQRPGSRQSPLLSNSSIDPVGQSMESTGQRAVNSEVGIPGGLVWPGVESMLGGDFDLTWMRRAKYQIRLLRTQDVRQRLLEECRHTPFTQALIGERPRAFYPVMNHLLDRRLGAEARLTAMVASIRIVDQWLSESKQDDLLAHELTLLTLEDGTRVTFGLSGVSFHEGLWQVALIAASGTRLYSLGFGLTDARTLFVANVQGPSLGVDGPALIRQVTHAAHGMRPPHLLLHALRLLAREWGVEVLIGIDPQNHIKGRWNLRRSRLRFDYAAFWMERGAVRSRDGNWRLPFALETRSLADVPTKRRAMYRRRYDMLTQLENALTSLSKHVQVAVSTAPSAGLNVEIENSRHHHAEPRPCNQLSELR
jgi:hypothetical protein